jgi:hypothetical protein
MFGSGIGASSTVNRSCAVGGACTGRFLATVLFACIASGTAHADFTPVGGGWFLQTEIDPFTDQTNVIGFRSDNAGNNGSSVGLRCLHGSFSIAIKNGDKLNEGDSYVVGLRVDHQQIYELTGTVIGTYFIEVNGDQMPDLMREINTGRQLAIRTTGASVSTMIFNLANSAKVMTPLLKSCSLEAPHAKAAPL